MQRRFIAITALALLTTNAAYAQDPEPAPAAAAALTPPKLVKAAQPEYPKSKLESGESATVALVLTLDETGHVTDATVSSSAGEEFDQAAIAAAQQLGFEPAQKDGQAIAAKIPFRFQFEAKAAEPAVGAPAVPPAAPVAAAPAAKPAAAPSEADALDIDVEGERPPREPTQRTISAEEITKMPGTNGDALRSLGSMPGVARVGAFDGLLVVRGSSPRDTQVFIDGTNVPLIYHFGGLSSVIPSEMLERIDFYPGNFGPQYGRATGGIVDAGVRSPKKDKLGGLLQVDLIDARVIVEGPINESTRFMVGGRRSWLDTWLKPALKEAGVGVTTAPVYYDYQAMIEHDLTKDTTLRLFGFGANDRMELTLNAPDSRDPAAGGQAGLRESFWRIQGRVDTRPTDDIRWTTTLSVGGDRQNNTVGNMYLDVKTLNVQGRSDVRAKLGSFATAVAGLDVRYDSYDGGYRFPPTEFESGANNGPVFGQPLVEVRGKANVSRPAAYAMLELTPFASLKLLPGVRSDYDQGTKRWTADPRIGARWDVHAGYPRTTIKGGAGIFHQPPEVYESVKPFGNDGLKSESANHYSLGFEQELARPLELSVEGFYKDLHGIIVAAPSIDSSANALTYQNVGLGRAYGSEFLLRYKPVKGENGFFGWLAYTLSRSERADAKGDEYYRYDYDQTHILTALGSYKFGRGWQLGGRFRYVTGSPYTPEIGGTVDYDAGSYAPVSSLDRNGSRMPAFHQLDFRMDKTWKHKDGAFTIYVDVQNVYNHQNTEGISYNFDYSQTTATHGLPILPIVGFKGEL